MKKNLDFNRNPEGINQHVLRSDEEIQKIIDSKPKNWTKKDFRGEGKLNKEKILTRKETERTGLIFYQTGVLVPWIGYAPMTSDPQTDVILFHHQGIPFCFILFFVELKL